MSKREERQKEVIKDAIAHLNGYLVLCERTMGYRAVALRDCLTDLNHFWDKKWFDDDEDQSTRDEIDQAIKDIEALHG